MKRVDPIVAAFNRIIGEIYWVESLEEAEERLARFLEDLDDDLREVLLERRRKICGSPGAVLDAVRLEAMAMEVKGEDELASRFLLAKSILATSYLVQCTPRWSSMTPREKARVLAPLYRASKALELAVEGFPRIDEERLRDAEVMLEIAARRMEREGLIEELQSYVDRMLVTLGVKDEG